MAYETDISVCLQQKWWCRALHEEDVELEEPVRAYEPQSHRERVPQGQEDDRDDTDGSLTGRNLRGIRKGGREDEKAGSR